MSATRLGEHWRAAWRGEVALLRLLLLDLLVWGTILNVATTGVAMMLLALGAPTWLVVVVWAACWPWNAFLCFSVWHTADRQPGQLAGFAKPLAALWFVAIAVV